MGKRINKRLTPPKYSQITEYWHGKYLTKDIKIVDTYVENSIPIIDDWGEPSCWGCGLFNESIYKDSTYQQLVKTDNYWDIWDLPTAKICYQKAHIIPHSVGGSNDVSNYFLLCRQCHQESPDMLISDYFFAYIHDNRQRNILANRINEIITIIDRMAEYLNIDFDRNRDSMKLLQMLNSEAIRYSNKAINPISTSMYTQAAI